MTIVNSFCSHTIKYSVVESPSKAAIQGWLRNGVFWHTLDVVIIAYIKEVQGVIHMEEQVSFIKHALFIHK